MKSSGGMEDCYTSSSSRHSKRKNRYLHPQSIITSKRNRLTCASNNMAPRSAPPSRFPPRTPPSGQLRASTGAPQRRQSQQVTPQDPDETDSELDLTPTPRRVARYRALAQPQPSSLVVELPSYNPHAGSRISPPVTRSRSSSFASPPISTPKTQGQAAKPVQVKFEEDATPPRRRASSANANVNSPRTRSQTRAEGQTGEEGQAGQAAQAAQAERPTKGKFNKHGKWEYDFDRRHSTKEDEMHEIMAEAERRVIAQIRKERRAARGRKGERK